MRWSMVPVSVAGHGAILAMLMLHAATGGDLPVPWPIKGLNPYIPAMVAVPDVAPPPRPPDTAPGPPTGGAPIDSPVGIKDEPVAPPTGPPTEGGLPGPGIGTTSGAPDGILSGPTTPVAPPKPEPMTPRLVRAGGDIRPPRKIVDAPVVYPEIARRANVSGEVVIEATIDERGVVTDARVIKSLPLLDGAALAAVRQWRYTPTTLNSVPVKVLLTITMNFSLGQRLP